MEEFFNNVYENNYWGNNNNNEYNGSSGGGSFMEFNIDTYVPFLKKFIVDNNIKNVVDLGCGDFICGNVIYDDLNITYTGYDTYKKIIDHHLNHFQSSKYSFIHLDFFNKKEHIMGGDLCILKDVLQHWEIHEIYTFLDFLIETKLFKYILISNCCFQILDDPINHDRFTPLSVHFFPLKKYNPIKLFNYHTKEVSVISLI